MISVEAALARICGAVSPLPAELVALDAAHGRVLAEDLVARRTQPPFAVSAMDGYALRAADAVAAGARLRVVGYVPAGGRFDGSVGLGEAVRIFTGAPLPDGADAIILQEQTTASDGVVTLLEAARAGRHIRRAGLDFREGDIGLLRGTKLSARHIGLAAAMNRPWLLVHRRPRVAILPTGDEVALPGDPIGPNQIVSSNGLALAALVSSAGGVPISLGIAPDRADALTAMAAGAAGVDLLLTTGGASVGEHDLVQQALGTAGMVLDFWKIAMRPGKPLIFGRMGATPVIGLPGNPVSALICALLFALPALAKLQGLPSFGHSIEPGFAGTDLPANDQRQDYIRARLHRDAAGHWQASPLAVQDSSMLSALAASDGLIVRPPNAPAAPQGAAIEVMRFADPIISL